MTIENDIISLGGVAATFELYAMGHTRKSLGLAVVDGRIVRVRQGWYLLPATPLPTVKAARVGGRLGCISGARHYGLSVRDSHRVHVAVRPFSARLRNPDEMSKRLADTRNPDVVIHWNDEGRAGSRFAASPLTCLTQMAMCVSPELTIAAVDSAIRLRLTTREEWMAAIAQFPRRLRRLLERINGASESIIESVVRFRLEMLGIDTRLQVRLSGVGRVDLLIGDRLVIELDGYLYHSDPERFEADRRRDARLSIRGYRVLRFSYHQVFNRWAEVRGAILAAIARGDHLAA